MSWMLLGALVTTTLAADHEVGAYDEARLPAGVAVALTDDGTVAEGHVALSCAEDGFRVEAKRRVLRVTWEGEGELPACRVTLHAADPAVLGLEGTAAAPTALSVIVAQPRRLSRLEGEALAVKVRGTGKLQIDRLKAAAIDVDVGGDAGVDLARVVVGDVGLTLTDHARGRVQKLETAALDLRATGETSVVLEGAATTATVRASGKADVDGLPLTVQDARVVSTGRSRVFLVVTGKAEAVASGRGAIGLPGEPAELVARTSGQGVVR